MKKLLDKLGRKGRKKAFRISGCVLGTLLVASIIGYVYTTLPWIIWCIVAIIVIALFITFAYIVQSWVWYIEDLMLEYKRNKNILSGGLAILALFACPFLVSAVLSKYEEYFMVKEIFEGISSLMITAMPAFVGLLGVQYTVALQEQNRKEDLRLGAKPFFRIGCRKIESFLDENKHTCSTMKIQLRMVNISDNIGIPIRVDSNENISTEYQFPYIPLASGETYEREVIIHSNNPFGDKVSIDVIYKDIYNNRYKATVEFIQHSKYELSETQIIREILLDKENEKNYLMFNVQGM